MKKWLIAATVMLPTLMEIIGMTVINVSLDHIRGALSAGIDEATWAITAYLVSNAIIIPITGWLSKLFGRKRYLIISISLFTVSSLLCGISWSLKSLIFFRIVQGIGGGALQPISQSILLETFPREQHGRAMAIFGMGIVFGPIMGPLLGGWITDNWSWRWIFFVNGPIGIVAVLLTLFIIYDPPYMKRIRIKIDYPGLVLLALGLGSLQFVLDKGQREEWFSSSLIVIFSIISALSLSLLVIFEIFSKRPVVNLRIFKDITFTTGNIIIFFTFFSLFGSIVLLPIYLQTLMGYTAYLAGLVLGPAGIAQLIASPVAGILAEKTNPKVPLIFGISMCALSIHLMSLFNLHTDFWTLVWPRAILGVGMAFVFIPLTTMTLSHIPKEKMMEATAMYNLLRNLGGSVGIAFVTTMLARKAQFHHFRLVEHLTPFDTSYMLAKEKITDILSTTGAATISPDGVVYRELLRQSNMLAFNDSFFLLSVFMLSVLPLALLLMKRGMTGKSSLH